jgi:hypothetical protein
MILDLQHFDICQPEPGILHVIDMTRNNQDLFEAATRCHMQALLSSDLKPKNALQQIVDQLFQEAFDGSTSKLISLGRMAPQSLSADSVMVSSPKTRKLYWRKAAAATSPEGFDALIERAASFLVVSSTDDTDEMRAQELFRRAGKSMIEAARSPFFGGNKTTVSYAGLDVVREFVFERVHDELISRGYLIGSGRIHLKHAKGRQRKAVQSEERHVFTLVRFAQRKSAEVVFGLIVQGRHLCHARLTAQGGVMRSDMKELVQRNIGTEHLADYPLRLKGEASARPENQRPR